MPIALIAALGFFIWNNGKAAIKNTRKYSIEGSLSLRSGKIAEV